MIDEQLKIELSKKYISEMPRIVRHFFPYSGHILLEDLVSAGLEGFAIALDSYDEARCDNLGAHIWMNIKWKLYDEMTRLNPYSLHSYRLQKAGELPVITFESTYPYEDCDFEIADPKGKSIVEEVRLNEFRKAVYDLLSERERKILYWYFYEDLDTVEIGAMLGISRERIRQLLIKMFNKLMKHLNPEGYDKWKFKFMF